MNCLILLLPILAQARFNIKITASPKPDHAGVEVDGYEESKISDTDRNIFKLSDERLYSAVTKVFGQKPTNVYLTSPTPWGDLYKNHGWRSGTKVLSSKSAKILTITSEPVMVSTQEFSNNSTHTVKFMAGMSQDVQDSISNSWSKGGEVGLGVELSVSVDFAVGSASATTSISHTASWGEEFSKSRTYTVGSTTGIEVEIPPGRNSQVNMSATRGNMEVEVVFAAYLKGDAAINYENKHNNHHFWKRDIRSLLEAVGSPTRIDAKEIMKIGFYSDMKSTVHSD